MATSGGQAMSKAAQRKRQRRRDLATSMMTRRVARAPWAVLIAYVDGTIDVHGFSDESQARFVLDIATNEMGRPDSGVVGASLKNLASSPDAAQAPER